VFKKRFPYFDNSDIVYFDNAATTQKPKEVINSQVEYYEQYCANTHRSSFGHANKATRKYEEARATLKEFINASKNEEIIFTKGVSESINFIASSFVKNFKTVIISSLEHHSNIVPWHMQGRTLNKGLEVVKCDDNLDFDLNCYEEILKNNPNSFVSITHISNAFGIIHDIRTIIDLAHKYNSVVLIDAAQSLAHMKVDMQELDVDFFAISGHKTFAPTGVGAIYVKEKFLKNLEPYQTGGATIHEVNFKNSVLLDSPYKFEAGTQNIAGVIGFAKALEFLSSIGYENTKVVEDDVYHYLDEQLKQFPNIIFYNNTKNSIATRSFNFKNISHDDIGILLDKMGVALRVGHHCAQPIMQKLGVKGTIRASMAFYNDCEDVDKLILALKKALSMLE